MAGFRTYIVALIIAGVFAYALIMGGIMYGINNNAPDNIQNDSYVNNLATSLGTELEKTSQDINSSERAFSDSPITVGSNSIFVDALANIWKVLKAGPTIMYNLIASLIANKILGNQAVILVLGIIGGVITMTIILYVWRLYRIGESD